MTAFWEQLITISIKSSLTALLFYKTEKSWICNIYLEIILPKRWVRWNRLYASKSGKPPHRLRRYLSNGGNWGRTAVPFPSLWRGDLAGTGRVLSDQLFIRPGRIFLNTTDHLTGCLSFPVSASCFKSRYAVRLARVRAIRTLLDFIPKKLYS